MLTAVLFDLDLTLVDSTKAEPFRRRGGWGRARGMAPRLPVFDGIHELLDLLGSQKVKTAVVTASPSMYCNAIVGHWGWEFDVAVCYHDTRLHKPHPAPIHYAIKRLGVSESDVAYVGDEVKDMKAARAAGVVAIGAVWGSKTPKALHDAGAHYMCETVAALDSLLRQLCHLPVDASSERGGASRPAEY